MDCPEGFLAQTLTRTAAAVGAADCNQQHARHRDCAGNSFCITLMLGKTPQKRKDKVT